MILNLFRKSTASDAVYAVYRAIVAQSRQPVFYADWGVPDTVTGRFDMISLHMSLVFRRLRAEKQAGAEFSQALFDLFFKDMDRSLREMGAGDLSVPKKVRKMTELFYALMTGINEAIDRGDHAGVAAVLRRNVLADADASHADRIAAYLFAQADSLAPQSLESIAAGRIEMAVAA
ncbi:ubiquinol-cytochrome C chaperone family protein [Devosia sp.]|uniref:ubiquinol-cytochrome C chaperone family protein n=1 Tax=Devosia sp. TaxID=1871048 RepID=UPI001AD2608E|nr:ubiquinol-cytochrome C chaperone family protein [Devosia sp.]MBN9310651.1 ubiquinol-cytochrome C chaperone [Devosia sp.]